MTARGENSDSLVAQVSLLIVFWREEILNNKKGRENEREGGREKEREIEREREIVILNAEWDMSVLKTHTNQFCFLHVREMYSWGPVSGPPLTQASCMVLTLARIVLYRSVFYFKLNAQNSLAHCYSQFMFLIIYFDIIYLSSCCFYYILGPGENLKSWRGGVGKDLLNR